MNIFRHRTTSQEASPNGHPAVVTDALPVATLCLSSDGEHDISFVRYSDGSVMLKQADDRVYLTAAQFALVSRFLDTGGF